MKMRLSFKLVLIFGFLSITSLVRAEDPIIAILNALRNFIANSPQEKVHLHLDKPYYAAGDTIWYKAYVVEAKNNLPTNISKTLNINVVNDKDSIVFEKKIPLKAGLGNGDIAIPLEFKNGTYVVYAYTNWMKNFDSDFFFKKAIKIENAFINSVITINSKKESNAAFTIFPEGGDLVEGIRSKIAFKCIEVNGKGKPTTGYVLNKAKEKIIEFESNKLGMGIFALSPLPDEVYSLMYVVDGIEKQVKLPEIKKQGYVLSVNNSDTANLSVRVTVSPQLLNGKELLLIAQGNGEIYYASKLNPQQVTTTLIPKDKFPTGVLQFTLFNSENQPLAERLVFINQRDNLKIYVAADKKEYKKREKVELSLNVPNSNDISGLGSYSISVTDEAKVPFQEDDENTILSNLLLSSDLKGYIEKPNYYFNDKNEVANRDLDYLMLTQGWRRFRWTEVLNNSSQPLIYKAEKGIDISGIVTTNAGAPIVNGKVVLFSGKGSVFTTDTVTNAEGKFSFDEMGFSDSTSFGLQARNEKEKKNVKIVLNQNPFPQFKTNEAVNTLVEINAAIYIANSKNQFQDSYYSYINSKEILLREVQIKGVKKNPGIERSTNLNGPGKADKVITAEDLSTSVSLFDYLTNYVNGVVRQGDSILFSRNLAVISSEGPAPVQFVLNGTFVTQDFVKDMDVNDIQNVEVLKSAALTSIYGLSGGFGGVILVTTKVSGERATSQYAPGIITFTPKGYDITKEFYSPKYTAENLNPKPDLRSTIYWNANVITDKDGKATLNYFNADGVGIYRVIIEGINADGKVGRTVFRYSVK